MESDGAVNLLCCGVLACEDAKLQCDLTEKASEGHRALTLAQPLCCTDTQTEPGQAHCYQLFVMHPPRARWEQLRLLCGRPGARIGRARRGGARTYARCAGKRSPGCVSLVSQSLKPKESILTAIMQMWYMQLKQQA